MTGNNYAWVRILERELIWIFKIEISSLTNNKSFKIHSLRNRVSEVDFRKRLSKGSSNGAADSASSPSSSPEMLIKTDAVKLTRELSNRVTSGATST